MPCRRPEHASGPIVQVNGIDFRMVSREVDLPRQIDDEHAARTALGNYQRGSQASKKRVPAGSQLGGLELRAAPGNAQTEESDSQHRQSRWLRDGRRT